MAKRTNLSSKRRAALGLIGASGLSWWVPAWAARAAALRVAAGDDPAGPLAPASTAASAPAPVAWAHAWAPFGEPKYPRGFDHFEFADPSANKGSTLHLSNPDRRTSFDKFNPFTIRGSSPGGLAIFMFESLAIPSGDEPATIYGLLAEEIAVAPDRSSVAFRLHPKARFWNGDPVLAADVKHSFEMVISKYAAPSYRSVFSGVERVVVEDERTIRFELNQRTLDMVGTVASLGVFSRKWGMGQDGKAKRFDEIVTEHPITSGPYVIESTDSGRRIVFKRRADYWAADLGVRRGFFNFDRIVYRYYSDGAVSMEAFKAGEFDLILEYSARRWARVHTGAKWEEGRIRKEVFETGMGAGFASYPINLRRPLFADRRVREALDWAFNFEWINRLGQYKRVYSVFSNSEFAAQGLPGPGELALLEPFRAQLPAAVFGPPYVPPRTDTSPAAARDNLRRARDLLAAAGWRLGDDGLLHDGAGRPFVFEYLSPEEGGERTVTVWRRNLEKLGVRMNVRRVDFALYRKRLEVFDYDLISIRVPDFTLPSALELIEQYGSKSADQEASNNFRGTRSAVVDSLLATMNQAGTMAQLRAASRAFDRVVMHEHWQVPYLYASNFRVSYWDRFERPKTLPLYYTIDSPNEALPAWPLVCWWARPGAAR